MSSPRAEKIAMTVDRQSTRWLSAVHPPLRPGCLIRLMVLY
jgi:hypothetical protein